MVRIVGAAAAVLGFLLRSILLVLPFLILVGGCAAVIYGVGMLTSAGAWIVAGGMAVVASVFVFAGQPDRRTK